jgi:hypothetical protein
MQSRFSDNSTAEVAGPHLLITHANGRTSRFDLSANVSYLAGSSGNCRIALSGDGVNPIHCRIWLDENCQLRVQDWNTGDRTRLNGQPIEEAVLNQGDELEIGDYRIAIVLSTTPAIPGEPARTFENAASPESAFDELTPADETEGSAAPPAAANASEFVYELELDSDEEFEDQQQFDFPGDAAPQPVVAGFEPVGADEEVEWLRMEVEQLRIELAERDALVQQLGNPGDPTEPEFDEDSENLSLVNRLEELLDELQSSDVRVRGLEDLLQASDEATRAEQEERLQLESWVTEIEQRVAQREAEATAELSRVMDRLKEAQARNQQADAHLEQALAANANAFSDSSNQIIKKLRSQLSDFRQRLEAAEKENDELRNTDRQQSADSATAKIQQLEEKLLQQQVEFSRERAELARKRVQLERLRDELEQKYKSNQKMDDADSRVMAMRQHLRDIHEEEKLEREERKQRGLGGRIARLLNRVGN